MSMRQYFAGLATAALAATAATALPSVYPTGTTIYDPSRAYNSYVIFGAPDGKSHLIDMNGNEVHRWEKSGFPSYYIDPKLVKGARGHVLVQLETIEQDGAGVVPGEPPEFRNKTIGEIDWNGNIVWKWGAEAPGGAAKQHHDWHRLPNGNTLVLAHWLHSVAGFQQPKLLDDVIYEVSPKGKIVWQWVASDHINELGFSDDQIKLIHASLSPDYFHINNMTPVGPNKWAKADDKRFAPDNIIFDARNANFIAVIDKMTGHIVWEIGPNYPSIPSRTKAVLPRPIDQISGQHDVHLIAEGLPGAGDLLVFDNQGEAGYPPAELGVNSGSRVLEIDPSTKEIVWQYTADLSDQPGWGFYSSFISSARRLPNGNTLIDEGMNGRLFQITPKGEIVWEYVSPYFAKTPVGSSGGTITSNWVYRAQPVPYDWVPDGTPHDETPVAPVDITKFRVPHASQN
ncbi:MAG: aryl-sulfate sulfotransferase [Rhizomicrobium sp.]